MRHGLDSLVDARTVMHDFRKCSSGSASCTFVLIQRMHPSLDQEGRTLLWHSAAQVISQTVPRQFDWEGEEPRPVAGGASCCQLKQGHKGPRPNAESRYCIASSNSAEFRFRRRTFKLNQRQSKPANCTVTTRPP